MPPSGVPLYAVPAKSFPGPDESGGVTARARMYGFIKPVLTAVQVIPLSVERSTPLPPVAAKRFVPEPAKASTILFVGN